MIQRERNDNYARKKMLSQRKKGGSFIKKHTDTHIKFKVYLKNVLEMIMRRAAGLEQWVNRGPGILRPGQASRRERQTGVDKERAMFRKTRVGGERETYWEATIGDKENGRQNKTGQWSHLLDTELQLLFTSYTWYGMSYGFVSCDLDWSLSSTIYYVCDCFDQAYFSYQ